MKAYFPRSCISTETFYYVCICLRNYTYIGNQKSYNDNEQCNNNYHLFYLLFYYKLYALYPFNYNCISRAYIRRIIRKHCRPHFIVGAYSAAQIMPYRSSVRQAC